mmetsp:Transcript_35548/g.42440  ORF Transcript_35548/g.42440 Transcript_35548/m.42440 type:complete len:96 (+) Transcript_35548:143-430(+)|eukprot:CAMPEP_0198248448 /NCGR_PEP_ID=MMETSP1447-20131203/200_1 /TAXON_ID=420782 /ORGANISM="Chaetoceros dichaeta, Strain CCMP1751" /LENGTH=95 /DNA_ID=CAMNT_0043932833 /DNA_START=112 /DNA_END=399 /DNA_ORIENTATION=+
MPIKRVKKVTTQPINVIFSHLTNQTRVKIWLYEDTRMTLEGTILGFDEYMNMTLDDAVECDTKKGRRTDVGRILLKGDAITLIQNVRPTPPVVST